MCAGRGITGIAENVDVNSRECMRSATGPRVGRQAGGSMAGLTSTTGVLSTASSASTSIRSPSRHDARMVLADGVGPVGRTGDEHAGQRLTHVVLGMRSQLVARRQVQPGEHHDLVARPQVLGAVGDLLLEADPRPRRAVALVRRIIEVLQRGLHPTDRHEAIARLHNNSLLTAAATARWLPRSVHLRSQLTAHQARQMSRHTRVPDLPEPGRLAVRGGAGCGYTCASGLPTCMYVSDDDAECAHPISESEGAVVSRDIMPFGDGSVLLLDAPPSSAPSPAEGVLSGEVVQFLVDAIAGGVTFDVLKRVAARLTDPRKPELASADVVRDAITEYLLRSGYGLVDVTELRKVGDSGWTVNGTADADRFHALSDVTGSVIHVRLE